MLFEDVANKYDDNFGGFLNPHFKRVNLSRSFLLAVKVVTKCGTTKIDYEKYSVWPLGLFVVFFFFFCLRSSYLDE